MDSIRQRLQQDFTATGQPLLKKALSDERLTPGEYTQLKNHYAGKDPAKATEFEQAFKDFANVQFGIAKTYDFAHHDCAFPARPTPASKSPPIQPSQTSKQRSTATAPGPKVIIPEAEMDRLLSQRNFWGYVSNLNSVSPGQKKEFINKLNLFVASLPVSNEKDYLFAKELMSSGKSLVLGRVVRLAE